MDCLSFKRNTFSIVDTEKNGSIDINIGSRKKEEKVTAR